MPYLKVEGAGNYVIREESPTGSRIESGEVFHASTSWAHKRRGCAFLVPATVQEYEAQQASTLDEPGTHALGTHDTESEEGDDLDGLSRSDAWALIKERGLDDQITYAEASADEMIALLKGDAEA